MLIQNLVSHSGKRYGVGTLERNARQYMDRDYVFAYISEAIQDWLHIKTHGNDKMLAETETCFHFTASQPVELAVLYPDIQPVLPTWLKSFDRARMNVTRADSDPSNLKGYFSVYLKRFPAGPVALPGNSPLPMLVNQEYVRTIGTNYCMYTVALRALKPGE